MSTIVSLPMLEKLGQACVPWDLFDIFILQRYGIRQIGDIRQQISYQEIRKRKVNTRRQEFKSGEQNLGNTRTNEINGWLGIGI